MKALDIYAFWVRLKMPICDVCFLMPLHSITQMDVLQAYFIVLRGQLEIANWLFSSFYCLFLAAQLPHSLRKYRPTVDSQV